MVLLVSALVYFTIFIVRVHGNASGNNWKKNWDMCQRMLVTPDFDPSLLLGGSWRTYYTWNMNLQNVCREMHFQNSTKQIVKRFRLEMDEYMQDRPSWENASLYVTRGSPDHGLLLIRENGPPGKFTAVANFERTNTMSPPIRSLPLLHFVLKFLNEGVYLLMMDCLLGITTLSTRLGHVPYRSQIYAAAKDLNIGDGLLACEQEKHGDELLLFGSDY